VVRPASFILDNKGIQRLARFKAGEITDAAQIASILSETYEWQDEWASGILDVIHSFDRRLAALRRIDTAMAKARQKKARKDQDTAGFQESTRETERRVSQRISAGRVPLQNRVNIASSQS